MSVSKVVLEARRAQHTVAALLSGSSSHRARGGWPLPLSLSHIPTRLFRDVAEAKTHMACASRPYSPSLAHLRWPVDTLSLLPLSSSKLPRGFFGAIVEAKAHAARHCSPTPWLPRPSAALDPNTETIDRSCPHCHEKDPLHHLAIKPTIA